MTSASWFRLRLTAVVSLLLAAQPALVDGFLSQLSPRGTTTKHRGGSSSGRRRQPEPTANAPAEAELSALHNAGMALLAEGRHDEAGLVFESVIDADPDADDSWAALGVCMHELEQPEAALACQKQVVRIRGAREAGGEDLFRERQFAELSSTAALLPPLPDGRRLSLATGSLDDCETGGRLWSSAAVLCRWQLRHAAEVRGSSVLELGCGTGAVGLFAAALGARRVLLTDGGPEALLALARSNVEAARRAELLEAGAEVEVASLVWGDASAAEATARHDLVLGSDVTYAAEAHAPLCASLARVARHSPGCRVVLAHEHRVVEEVREVGDVGDVGEAWEVVVEGEGEEEVAGRAGDEKLAAFVAAAEAAGLVVRTLRTEREGERLVSLLEVVVDGLP